MITLATNLKAGAAATQFLNFEFNSMVKMGNKFLCAGDAGLFEHTGTMDNGVAITSYFEPITTDFGIASEKKLRSIYLGYEADADLTLTISTDLGYSEIITIPAAAAGQKARKVPVSRSVRGRYFTFQIKSTGADFSVDEIKVLPIVIGHGRDKN